MIQQTRVRFALCCATLLLATFNAQAQSSYTIQGRVLAPNGRPPSVAVKVTLMNYGRPVIHIFTDLSGNFIFSGVGRGSYSITAEGDGQEFETTTINVEVGGIGAQQVFAQDIQLTAKRSKTLPRAAVVNAFQQDVPKAAAETFERAMKVSGGGKSEPAMKLMREALKLFPTYFEAHLALGNELLKVGQLNEAIDELDEARKINPNDDRAYQSFGLIMMQQ
jgi:tetratricopeptide (TPR) repeat protein